MPDPEAINLGNDAVTLDGTVLYADLAESTSLVNDYKDYFAAEIYKAYLVAAARLITHEGGKITAFDGDRIMAVFIGSSKNTSAVRCALRINWAVQNIIKPAIRAQYPNSAYQLSHAVGVDQSDLFVVRTGIRGSNDLVWVGRAANYAAKLCSMREGQYASIITEQVYNHMSDSAKFGGSPKRSMWEKVMWNERGLAVYRSDWHWEL